MFLTKIFFIAAIGACCLTSRAREMAPLPEAPSARSGYALAYDANRNVVVLFGGQDINSKRLGDTWEWNGVWKKTEITGPAERINAAIAYDAGLKKVVLFGGSTNSGAQNDMWAYDGISWQIIKNGAAPPARQLSAMAFDKKEEQLVLFGGWDVNKNLLADTWAWKENTWSKLNIEGPSPRASHAMIYNSDLDVVLVYGGFSPDVLRELWQLKDGKWLNLNTADAPFRGHTVIGYDNNNKRILVFGGFGTEGRTNELWQYANGHWLQIKEGDVLPPPRAEHKGVFIPGRGLFIFGGVIGVDPNTRDRGNDTWLYHDGAWQKLNE